MLPVRRNVTITGGNGFVGRLLREGLGDRGYRIDVFDRLRGPLVDVLRHRYLGKRSDLVGRSSAKVLRKALALAEGLALRTGRLVPSSDDILAGRELLAERFRGADAVIHLAALAHPRVPGMGESDYRRINLDGAVNVFEAARLAGVPKLVFASSVQVYGINRPVRLDQLPILESNYCPSGSEGQSHYGLLKLEVERYLAEHAPGSGTQAVSLRLEFPGVRSRYPWNQYISTSVENLVAGFVAALEADLPAGAEVYNLADAEVDPAIVDIQGFVRRRWPDVPNRTRGNQCLLGTEKARAQLGYDPRPGGTYFELGAMW